MKSHHYKQRGINAIGILRQILNTPEDDMRKEPDTGPGRDLEVELLYNKSKAFCPVNSKKTTALCPVCRFLSAFRYSWETIEKLKKEIITIQEGGHASNKER